MNTAIPTENQGVSNFGLIKARNLEALEHEQLAQEAPPDIQPVLDEVTAHLEKLLSLAKQAKEPIERQMLKSMRQVYGEYEPDKLAAIRRMGGSEVFVLLTMTKYRACVAWINDIYRGSNERFWSLAPTPLADLPPDIEGRIHRDGQELFSMVIQNLASLGMIADPEYVEEEIQKYEKEIRDITRRNLQKEAEKRCERMIERIDDQMTEGGWEEAFWPVISDLVMLKAGVMKGPVVRRRQKHKWTEQEGEWVIQAEDVLVPEFDRVSPFDLYPLSGATKVEDGVFERHHLTRSDLVSMIGVPGYSEENIRKALEEYGEKGKRDIQSVDTELASLRDGQTQGLYDSGKIEAYEFWGTLQGRLLQDRGIPVEDPDLEYEVNAWKVGSYTIRLILNPDKLGRKPYSVDSFERIPGAFWGKGLPETMADLQDVCNATARAIVNNAGLASGPQVEVDKTLCNNSEELWPWKVWQRTKSQMTEGPAVRFTQPQVIVQPLLQVYQTFSAMADDQTGVPRWSHGNTDIGGAGQTSSGLSMLMTYAARGIKEVISHIDVLVKETLHRTYDYNMLYDPDRSIKGDAQVVAKASSALLAKEQRLVRTSEFLASTLNPVDLEIVGVKGRAKLLREVGKMLEIDIDDIIPGGEEELQKLHERVMQMEQMKAQQGASSAGVSPPGGSPPESGYVPPKKQIPLDPAGAPQGGVDANVMQHMSRPL